MKKYLPLQFLALLLFSNLSLYSQILENYLKIKGVSNLCTAAHTSHTYLSGSYSVNSNYIDVDFNSQDAIFKISMNTRLRITRGGGGLYFKDITVIDDEAGWLVKAFDSFGLQSDIVMAIIEAINPAVYLQMRDLVSKAFNTNFENWNGKMWAVLALNLDYYDYIVNGR